MPQFVYKAIGPGGQVTDGTITADNRTTAMALVRGSGLVPVRMELRRGTRSGRGLFRRDRPSPRDLMLFTRQLAMLVATETPLERALEIVRESQGDGPLAALSGDLLESLRGGASFAETLERRRDVFPSLYSGIVRAGEAGGKLGGALEEIATILERNETLKQTVRSALTYPTLVLILTGVSLVVLLLYVVPEFQPMLEHSGEPLPLATRVVLAASSIASQYGWLLSIGLAAMVLAMWRLRVRAGGSAALDRIVIKIPLIGSLVRRYETARFARTLGVLAGNGVPLLNAVDIAAGVLGNRAIAQAVRAAREPLSRGEGLARPLERSAVFPVMAVQLIRVGEEGGRLSDMLIRIADVFDRETELTVQRLLSLLTPVVTIGLGALIAFIIGSILSAILQSYSAAL